MERSWEESSLKVQGRFTLSSSDCPLVHTEYELEERRSTLVKYFAVSGNCSSDARLSVRLVLEATQAKPHFAISQTFIGMLGVVFDCVATKTG